MFAQQVDAEFFAGFREAPHPVEREDVGEDTAPLVIVHEIEELEGHFFAGGREGAVDGCAVVVVDTRMLVVEGAVENAAAEGFVGEHAGNKRFEFDVAVVERCWDGPGELELVRLEVVLFALGAFFTSAGFFGAGQSTDHGTEMLSPGAGADGPDSTAVVANRCFPKILNTDEEGARHFEAAREHAGAATDGIGAFAAHPFFDFVPLFFDTCPTVAKGVNIDMDVAKSVIVVGGIFIVDASFELESGRGDIGNNPFAVPDGVGRSSDGWSTEPHVRVLFVPRVEGSIQLGVDVGVGRKRINISHWEVAGAMEDELQGVARGSIGYGCFVKTTCGWRFLFRGAMLGCLLLPAGSFVDEFGCNGIALVVFPLARLRIFLISHGRCPGLVYGKQT